ncbi:hypothetical protein B488_10350 [Liberibacter crescens BT-1]|uniref:DUF1134 domain-containing protein n=1 Tax=Liberibacter crescens (strain BT-1) TaxID=1215343 RepID=L0EVR9_LIBCB|nr:DUF1134 domain-containing protein [Liberibacter crescens]AGA65027.1 hypothetical protein B488_10350 [Liberibacter crescens BT-1]AMC13033.1 hypothetical protein RL73_05260 [Liberibacter crescens]
MCILYLQPLSKAYINLIKTTYILIVSSLCILWINTPAFARLEDKDQYSLDEIVQTGSNFFGSASGGLAKIVENAFENYGLPNGYILGREGTGSLILGVTYGEGTLNTRNAGQYNVFWQGPSLGLDVGGNGSRCMMLVYNLPNINSIYTRYGRAGVSAFIVAGLGMTVLRNKEITIVPIRTGLGLHLGISAGYLKISPTPTWNPF